MVKKGHFTVELVNAITKEPFKEHTDCNGQTYVEVEPEAEYFIHVCNDSDIKVDWKFYVDEQDLGYVKWTLSNTCAYCGIAIFCGEEEYEKALKFSKLGTTRSHTNEGSSCWTGQIEVVVEYPSNTPRLNSKKASLESKKLVDGLEEVDYVAGVFNQKGVRTTKGITAIESNALWSERDVQNEDSGEQMKKDYEKGELMEEFGLFYCTTVGLIYAGVLPKPPLWDHARMLKPFDPKISTGGKELDIEPEIIVHEGVDGIIERKEYELFNLSHLSESESEEDETSSQDMN